MCLCANQSVACMQLSHCILEDSPCRVCSGLPSILLAARSSHVGLCVRKLMEACLASLHA